MPPDLLACAPEPEGPQNPTDQTAALYVLSLTMAGRDCRDRLGKVRGLLEGITPDRTLSR